MVFQQVEKGYPDFYNLDIECLEFLWTSKVYDICISIVYASFV